MMSYLICDISRQNIFSFQFHVNNYRVLTNSKLGLFYSNFLILTPTFSKVPIEKYGKTPSFSVKQHFYSYFQNPSENSEVGLWSIFCGISSTYIMAKRWKTLKASTIFHDLLVCMYTF